MDQLYKKYQIKNYGRGDAGYFWKFCFVVILLNMVTMMAFSQSIRITGIVTDNNNPLQGVNITIKGASTSAVTDVSGRFSITINATTDVLVFTSVGYEKLEVPVGNQKTINVKLIAQNSNLNEVVVVGYGTQKKVNLTGAISVVGKEVLENRPVTNVIGALQGAAPGLVVTRSSGQPGSEGYNLNVRGFSSVNGTNSPLVIIDGAEGSLSLLNPYDIESISVLKDAAASAIYGAKAASGVILVTTKKGTKGKTKVDFTTLETSNRFYGLPQTVDSYQEAQMENLAFTNAGLPVYWSAQQMANFANPNVLYAPNATNPSALDYFTKNNEFADLVLRKGTFSQEQNLTVSGGGDQTTYLIGLGYYTEDGVFKLGPDGTKRYNIRLNTHTKLNSIFTFDSRLSYTFQPTQSPIQSVSGESILYEIYTIRDNNPVFLPNSNDTKYPNNTANPYAILKDGGYNDSQTQNINAVFNLGAANFAKGLSINLIYAPYIEQDNQDIFARTIPLWTLAPTPVGYLFNPNSFTQNRASIYSQNIQALANYDLTLKSGHHFHALGGFEYKYYNYNYTSAQLKALISNNVPSLNYGSSPTTPPVVGNNIQANAWVSYFGRLTYDYNEKYLFEADLRNDASSRLAAGHQSQTFPAFSAGWNINKEEWFGSLSKTFDLLKVRASWGRLGNAQLGALTTNNYNSYPLLSTGPATAFNNVSNPSLYQATLPSPSLGWETIETSDAGLDVGLLNNRLTGSFDYFVRKNNNMLITVAEPAQFGLGNGYSNSASLKTWGWEVTIGWKDNINSFNYFANFNIGDNKNIVTSYAGTSVYVPGTNGPLVGQPLNSIYGYIAQGYFTSAADVASHAFQDKNNAAGDIKYKDINGDNVINAGAGTAANHGDLVNLGNTSPRYVFGFTTGFSWKNIDFSVFLQGVGKASMMPSLDAIVPYQASYYQAWKIQTDYWTPENLNARFPRLYLGGNSNVLPSTHWIQNAKYLDLKNLQFGYTLSTRVSQKIGVQKVRIFFSGQDLWQVNGMWFKYYSAEEPNGTYLNYPFFRSYALGLNVTL